jgi:hypothetical protein
VDFSESRHIWRKRWKLTLILIVLASAGTGAAAITLPRSYQSDSSVVLLASRSAARLNGGNPYLSFSPSLTLTADALSQELMAPGTVRDLVKMGYTDAYTVTLAPYTTTTTGSVLNVTVSGGNRAAIEHTLSAVTGQISVALSRLQIGVKPKSRIRAATLSFAPQPALSISQTARPLIAVVALGLLLALGLPIIVDGRIARRPAKRRPAKTAPRPSERAQGLAAAPPSAGTALTKRQRPRRWPPTRNRRKSRSASRAGKSAS